MKKVLITNGGFLGIAIAKKLHSKGDQITSLDIDYDVPSDCYESRIVGSVSDIDQRASAMTGAEEVYHLAAVLGTTELLAMPRLALEINVLGTLNAT